MLTVHHLGLSQSERIVWLCEELEIPYELKLYARDSVTRLAPATYKALHPLGTAPIITDGPLVMAESGAIVEYIIAKHGGGRLALTPDSPAFADYLYWFHFSNGSMMPRAMADLIIDQLGVAKENFIVSFFRARGVMSFVRARMIVSFMQARSDAVYGLLETRLGEATYLAGDLFTAADIMMVFGLTTMRAFVARDLSPYPNILAYLARIGARPAYQRAMKKGDPDLVPMLT